MSTREVDPELEALLEFLKESRGFDFTGYKRTTLARRIQKRMQTVGIEGYGPYLDYLQVHQKEFGDLFDTILINVTSFFRDPPVWEFVAESVIPSILAGKGREGRIRVWCAGVASGEEAYTVAMLFAEALGKDELERRVKVYATDVDEGAVLHARHASYAPKDLEAVAPEMVQRYFEQGPDGLVVAPDLRRAVIFGRHDLVQDAPISRVDLVSCRNTLMYLTGETQTKVAANLRYALNEGGFLILGRSEMLLSQARAFQPVDLRNRVFRKVGAPDEARVPGEGLVAGRGGGPSGRWQPWQMALEAGPAPQIFIDPDGRLMAANRRARELFGLVETDFGRPFQDLEVSFRPLELRSVIEDAKEERRIVSVREVAWTREAGSTRFFDIEVQVFQGLDGEEGGVGVSFSEVTRDLELRRELEHANQELETAMEELQSTNEELETTNEELQSTNEELETTNEELQATNEELETMNEEVQATNEELSAVNQQIQVRSEEVDRLNAFLESILGSVNSAVIVLNKDLGILLWNRRAEDLWGLRPGEAEGQPFLNLDIGLPVADLKPSLRAALTGDSPVGALTIDATNRRGQPVRCRVVLTPIQGRDEVRGIVMLMDTEPRSEEGQTG